MVSKLMQHGDSLPESCLAVKEGAQNGLVLAAVELLRGGGG